MPRHHRKTYSSSDSSSHCNDSLDKSETGCSGTDISVSSYSDHTSKTCDEGCEGGACGGCGGCGGGDCSVSSVSDSSASSFSSESCSVNLDTSGSADCSEHSSSSSSSSHKVYKGKGKGKAHHEAAHHAGAHGGATRKLFVITWGPEPSGRRGQECIYVNGKAHATIVLRKGVTYYFEVKQTADAYGKYKHAFMLTSAHVGNFNGVKPEPVNGSFEALYQGMATFKVGSGTPEVFHYQCPYHAYEGGYVLVR